MRCRAVALVVVVLASPAAGVHAQRAFEIFATLTDVNGGPAVGVQPRDIRVVEDGADARVVRVEAIDWPLKVQVLVDNGYGLESQNIIHLRNGVRGFFEVLPTSAEVTFVTSAPQPRFLVQGATDSAALVESVGRLAPDPGVGHLLDALNEAAERVERDPVSHFAVIVAVATRVGDAQALESQVERLLGRLGELPITVHVVQYDGSSRRTQTGGANQTEVGLAATRATRGRYEAISSASRLATLLPEIGEDIAKSYLDGRFRITVERPAGASGGLDHVQIGTRGGLRATKVSLEPRLP